LEEERNEVCVVRTLTGSRSITKETCQVTRVSMFSDGWSTNDGNSAQIADPILPLEISPNFRNYFLN
jgi:hypothetical protein